MKNILIVQTARAGSKSVPNKNIAFVTRQKMLFEVPINKVCENVDANIDVCISTDCLTIIERMASNDFVTLIKRPKSLSGDNDSHHDVMIHAVNHMEAKRGKIYDFVVVLLGNSLGCDLKVIKDSIDTIVKEKYTGAMTVSKFNMFNPYRAFKIQDDEIQNQINVPDLTNDKNCMGDVYFFNGSCFICDRNILISKKGKNPFPWVGDRILPIIEDLPKMEVDDFWQLSHVRKQCSTTWHKYLTREQKQKIEEIPLTSKQWSGYKNVEFNLKIWESVFRRYIVESSETIIKNDIGTNILDYGFGPGWSKVVGRKLTNCNIVGLDIDLPKQNLEFAKFHKINDMSTHKWNGEVMPFPDNTFAMIIAKASFHKMRNTNPDTMLNELFRISKPGALWVIGPKYQWDKFINLINQPGYRSRYEPIINSKNIQFSWFDWDLNSDQNNIFQPVYAQE
jgi:CMP-N-acetylneuraminic acid synthetase/SAM-dependent methyltransferase